MASLKEIGAFDTHEAEKLERQLVELQDNVAAAIDATALAAMSRLTPTAPIQTTYSAQPGDMVRLRLATGKTITITLPAATRRNQGQMIGIDVDQTVGTCVVQVAPGSSIDGSQSITLANVVGLSVFISDGGDWSANLVQSAGSSVSPATTIVTETAFGQASAVGTGVLYARNDHTHGTPATPVTSLAATAPGLSASGATGAVTVTLNEDRIKILASYHP